MVQNTTGVWLEAIHSFTKWKGARHKEVGFVSSDGSTVSSGRMPRKNSSRENSHSFGKNIRNVGKDMGKINWVVKLQTFFEFSAPKLEEDFHPF